MSQDDRLPKLIEAKKHEFTKEDVKNLRQKVIDEKEVFKALFPDYYELLFPNK